MEGLKLIPYLALMLCIAGIVIGASAVTLGKFGDTMSDKCWNSSYSFVLADDNCNGTSIGTENAGSSPGKNFSYEYWTVYESKVSQSDVAEQLPTLAIIGVMVVIISVLAGVFVYMKYFG